MFSKDEKSRVEAINRITWIFKTSLNKNIKLPNDIFLMEIDEANDQVDKPIGEYNVCNLYECFLIFNLLGYIRLSGVWYSLEEVKNTKL